MTAIKTSAILLAAGNSGRMGFSKLLLSFKKNRSFFEEIVSQYLLFGCDKIIVMVNPKDVELAQKFNQKIKCNEIEFVVNDNPDLGRFRSIRLGIQRIITGSNCFLHNIDNPFTDLALLKMLSDALERNSCAILEYEGKRGHPLLMSSEICELIRKIKLDETNIRDIIDQNKQKIVKVTDKKILLNINSPMNYFEAFGIMPEPYRF